MSKNDFSKPIYSLFFVLLILSSCNGQVKPIAQKESDQPLSGQVKIPLAKGANVNFSFRSGIEDAEGNLWFGSNGDGLYKYDGKLFIHYGMEQGLNSNFIYSILHDKLGTIWVGTNKGLNRLEGNNFKSISIVLANHSSGFLANDNKNNVHAENAVWSLMQDKKGVMWIGTDDGVYCYNGKEFSRFLDNQTVVNKDSLKLKGIFSILESKNGTIWFAECADEGISSYDGKTLSRIIPYKEIRRTDRIIEDNHNNLWFATAFKGIGKYDSKNYTQNIFKTRELNGSYNIQEDANGNIWFDTQDGLGFYDGNQHRILTEKDGINLKDMIPILVDKKGNLWLSCKGMNLYKYDGKTYANYSE